jgi:tRNA threonylcarbamoyladenosine biosynthesis protein TsaE
MDINLTTLEHTARLGRALAKTLGALDAPGLLLLEGGLGAGKTTLARFLVEALPGGDEAEVSSPSFTLCNIYPTRPEVWHYDLYRLEDASASDELLDALDRLADQPAGEPLLMLLEWPERLASSFLPASYLHCRLTAEQNDRRAFFTGCGKAAQASLERLRALLEGLV